MLLLLLLLLLLLERLTDGARWLSLSSCVGSYPCWVAVLCSCCVYLR